MDVVIYLFKDVVKEEHKKNIINVKYSSNVQIMTSMIITCF